MQGSTLDVDEGSWDWGRAKAATAIPGLLHIAERDRVGRSLCHPLMVLVGERTARFIEPMLLLRTGKLPEGDCWQYEVKFDGYRALAITASS